jgi:hypothetical protein
VLVRAINKLRPQLLGNGNAVKDCDQSPSEHDPQRHAAFLVRLREITGQASGPVEDLLDAVGELFQTVDRYRQTAERLTMENAALAEQLSDAAKKIELRCAGCDDEETVNAIIKLLGLNEDAFHDEVVDAVRELKTSRNGDLDRVLDSYLLDLLIEYPHIGVERIAVIREAV